MWWGEDEHTQKKVKGLVGGQGKGGCPSLRYYTVPKYTS